MRRIRQIQKTTQHNDDDMKQPVKALWKLSRFDSVPSRVKEQLEVTYCQFISSFQVTTRY